jgi:tRNA pseudouridine55 synthase
VTGILLVDKPEGMTSAGVIRALKGLLGRTKVGHLGTLDPFASGLLPLCLGEATKVARWLFLERKRYEGTIRLGRATDTLDRTGQTVETRGVPPFDGAALDALARRFTGRQTQVPPMYSALKREGVPLYELARKGIDVDRAPRDIEIHELTLAPAGPDAIDFQVGCSKGTYVRVLAADLGAALGTVAHLERLRRTEVGAFRVEAALTVDAAMLLPPDAPLPLVPVRAALADYVGYPASPDVLVQLRRGQQEPLRRLPPATRPGETALLLGPGGDVAAVIEAPAGEWRLARLRGRPDRRGATARLPAFTLQGSNPMLNRHAYSERRKRRRDDREWPS